MFNPRPKQAEILAYVSGKMGIPAVPGSGKTHTLSYLASQLIAKGFVADDQEILIVTLVNSAVDNFTNRISRFVQQAGLLQKMGYRVRTLHGLAHDIIKERPDLAGVSEQFVIADENECRLMFEQISSAYLHDHPELTDLYLDPSIDLDKDFSVKKQWFSQFADIAGNFIGQAKDFQLTPLQLVEITNTKDFDLPLFKFGVEVFNEYQRGLRFRNAVDFNDLTRLAIQVLDSDENFLARLRYRWPYILEDETQDSSSIQEIILRKLVGNSGNWVRVGDTNQAIYETFTTASPEFLHRFLAEQNVITRDLPNSGRSNQSIVNLANFLINWTISKHPVMALRNALSTPYIEPAPEGDPQPNPPDHPEAIYIQKKPLTASGEKQMVIRSLQKWLPENQDKTVAILCPIGFYAEEVVDALKEVNIEVVELLQTTDRTRKVCRLLEKCLASISDPSNVAKFSTAFENYLRFSSDNDEENPQIESYLSNLRKLRLLEDFLYPKTEGTSVDEHTQDLLSFSAMVNFISHMRRWHFSAALPIDQLLLVIGNDLFSSPQDLALTHKLSLMLDLMAKDHREYRLPEFIVELSEISRNQRKFIGFSDDESAFNPELHKGKVLVTTYHKAKGLEWDRVYLMSVNNYDFPSLQENDQYKGEKWYVRGKLNLEAELIAQLKSAYAHDASAFAREPGAATISSRRDYAAERLRLLYVGITRARQSLIITWNSGKRENCTMALPLQALSIYREENSHAPA